MSSSLFVPKNVLSRGEMMGFEKVLKGICGLILFFVVPLISFGQSCPTSAKNPWEWPSHSNWLIGNGIKGKFSGGNIVISSQPNVTTYEGTSGASDDWGNLLFHNNGRMVWDAQGNLKFSGLLEGNEGGSTGPNGSASQGVITVRHPLDTLNYYVFTVDDVLTGSAKGLNYCVLNRDGSLQSGPIRLGSYRTMEGIAATTHANGVDIWVTAYGSSGANFYTYLITCTGVVKSPVISAIAPVVTGDMERGGLAFSWDSKLFAQVHPDYNPNGDKEVTVYKFDNQTGLISDPHHISDPGSVDSPYDVTFSPDNSKLYFSTGFGTLGYYDVSSMNTATMAASVKFIKGVNTGSHSAIEIGADGNLYMATPYGAMGKLSGSMNAGTLTFTNIPGATTNRGLPTMYLPPFEEPDIQEVGPFCTTDPPVDLNTKWICKGINAEDPVNNPDAYSGTGITDKGKGIFSPAVAKEGTHMIIFKRCSVDDTIYIIVKPCECPDTTLKPIPPICADGSIDLNGYKITAEAGSWSLISSPAGSAATLTGTLFQANLSPGKYTVRYTLDKKIKGCAESAERVITVYPLPVVTATSGTINCYGQSTTCTASGATSYTWSSGDLGQSITVTPLAATSYTVTGVDVNGCKDTAIVHIDVPAKLELNTVVTNINCIGKDNGTASVTATGGTPGYTYLWSNGETTPAITGLPLGTYTVLVTDSKSCLVTVSVTVGTPVLPTADFNFSTACFGTPVRFLDHSNPGNGNTIVSYKWDFGDPTSPNNSDDSDSPQPHIYNVMSSYKVKLLIVTNNGCKDSITKQVDVWPVPKADFGSPISGCKPVCADFKDLSTITGGVISKWNWNFGDPGSGAANTSNSQFPETHCYFNSGFYSVKLIVETDKGCRDTVTKKDIVNVLSSPKAAFTSDKVEAQIFNPSFNFYDQSTGLPTSWHWDFGVTSLLNDTSNILNPKWTYADIGKYNVCLTVKNKIGCSDYVCHPVTVTPYWTFYIPNAFTPNADGDNDFFNGQGYNITQYQMWIYDRWGNMIYTTGKANNPDNSVPWNGKANNGQELAQQDVYVWKVELKDIFNKAHSYIGTVTLVK